MTQAQFEAVSAEVLEAGTVDARTLAVSAEVLIAMPTALNVLATSAEVLILSALYHSNLFDHTGTERDVFQWDGTNLIPMTFSN